MKETIKNKKMKIRIINNWKISLIYNYSLVKKIKKLKGLTKIVKMCDTVIIIRNQSIDSIKKVIIIG
jgi:hypothetical protein